ncbi:hypothetical protein PV11_08758 [Exophiala sideris]|uniref:Uncharacterized protein n=1 Tax=Exophiala sideris TaxID=1016849 RepID=A0A0D1YPG2_9EURO|nr:hypothetical protein PV11_08758 [Exophiala sideris]
MILAVVGLAAMLGVSYTAGFDIPQTTGHAAFDLRGWSPRPTPGPLHHLHQGGLEKRALSSICAYYNDVPLLSCPASQFCNYDTNAPFMACCTTNSQGMFDDGCIFATTCVGQSKSSQICGTTMVGDCGYDTADCGFNTDFPECVTIVGLYGFESWTTYSCSARGGNLTVTLNYPPTTTAGTTTANTTSDVRTSTTSTISSHLPSTSTSSIPASTSTAPTSTSSTPASTTTSEAISAPTSSTTHDPSHTGAIAGGVVGGVAGLLIIAGIIGFIIHRIRVKRRENGFVEDTAEMTGTPYTQT